MAEVRVEFVTAKSVPDCARTFEAAAKANYGGFRKLLRGVNALRNNGAGDGGLEFFTPTPNGSGGPRPAYTSGVRVPGFNQLHGASVMTVHIYVVDRGAQREVQLVGPTRMGDGGSTKKLVNGIAAAF